MHNFLDGKDYIKYIPVCSRCGEPIPKDESIYIIENLYESDSSYKCNKEYEVCPSSCKKCGAHFEYIVGMEKPDTITVKY